MYFRKYKKVGNEKKCMNIKFHLPVLEDNEKDMTRKF